MFKQHHEEIRRNEEFSVADLVEGLALYAAAVVRAGAVPGQVGAASMGFIEEFLRFVRAGERRDQEGAGS